jgi:hypothetical protein
MKGFLDFSNKWPGPLQMGGIHKNRVGLLKNLFLENHWAMKA